MFTSTLRVDRVSFASVIRTIHRTTRAVLNEGIAFVMRVRAGVLNVVKYIGAMATVWANVAEEHRQKDEAVTGPE